MKKLEDKVAIVTAATAGIGLASAKKLAQNGALVYIAGLEDELAEKALAECRQEKLNVKFHPFNAFDYEGYHVMVEHVAKEEGRLDILVNNFGIGIPTKDFDILTGDPYAFFDILQKNIGSVYLPCKPAIRYMAGHGGGNIVNISSIGGLLPDVSRLGYGVSKAAINYLTKAIALQFGSKNIRCNAVAPGMIGTDAVKKSMTGDFQKAFLRHVPLGRVGEPEDIANAVLFLASDDSSFITGHILDVAGGFGIGTPEYADAVKG